MLQQHVPLSRPAIELRSIEDHVVAQPLEQAAHHVQQDHVVGRLGDGDMELGVPLRLQRRIVEFMRRLDRLEPLGQDLAVVLRAAKRGVVGADPVERLAELDEIQGRLGMALEHVGERVGDTGRDRVADVGSAAVAGLHEARGLHLLQRLAQGRPRDIQLLGQLPFGRQAIARLQQALQDHSLELARHGAGQFFLPYFRVSHAAFP